MVEEIKDMRIDKEDLLVNFDIVSLFTKIWVDDAIEVIKELTDEDTTKIVKVCLKAT